MSAGRSQTPALALLPDDSNLLGESGEAHVSGMPFRLDIVETGEQWVVTCTTPHGKAVSRIPAPFSPAVLHRALADIEKALIRSYSPVTTRRAAPVDQAVREFGETLSDAVLTGDVRRLFDRCRQDARERQTSLRILLDTDGPNVSVIPWEFTVDPNARDEYLALRVPIIRSPHLIGPVSSSRVALPLRVLGVSAPPADLPALDTQREREDISKAFWQRLTPGDVHIEWLHEDRWAELAEAIRSHPWHVLHIMSHGGFDPEAGGGYIQLSGENGTARPISAVDLARLISENPSLRLIVLNACESAFSSTEGIFTSTAEKLVREGVPAVVAMQYEITDTAALVFASSFYGQIAQGVPVDRAMTRARETVKMTNDSLEWATPVLFLSSEETQIFEVPEQPHAMRRHEHSQLTPEPPPKHEPDLRRLRVLRPAGPCGHMAAGPGDFLAVAGSDGAVRVISVSTGQVLSECVLPQRTRLIQLAWSPWPRHLASLHEDGTIVVWDAETESAGADHSGTGAATGSVAAIGPAAVRGPAHRLTASHVTAHRRDRIQWQRQVARRRWRRRVHIFDTQGNHARELRLEPDRLTGSQWLVSRPGASLVLFTPGDLNILVAAGDGPVRQFDVHGRVLMTLPHPKPVLSIAVTHDRLATGSADGRIRTWSWDGHLVMADRARLSRRAPGVLP